MAHAPELLARVPKGYCNARAEEGEENQCAAAARELARAKVDLRDRSSGFSF